MNKQSITPDEIKILSQYVYKISGISIDDSKAYLLETRLGIFLDETGSKSFEELVRKAQLESGKALERKIIDAITTNETLFFRDNSPFELLRHKILPELIDKRTANGTLSLKAPLRLWSAAASTGQEIYSIAIVIKETIPDLNKFNLEMLGTDISDAAIAQASYGQYNKFEIERGLPKNDLQKYFVPNGNSWKIKEDIRAMVDFKKLNLMEPFKNLGKFDVIFCRNVAIYFNLEDRKRLFSRIAEVLEPDGYLIVGSTESLTGICPFLNPKRHLKGVFYELQ